MTVTSSLEVLVLSIDGARYALPLERVVEAARRVTITPLPSAPDVVLGVIVHRGTPVPVVDLRSRLGRAARPPALGDHLVLARTARRTVALVVDQIVTARKLDATQLHPPIGGDPQIAGIAVVEGDLWMIEDLDALLSESQDAAIDRALEAAS